MLRAFVLTPLLLLPTVFLSSALGQEAPKPLRAGMIGLDTSHVTAFAQLLNKPGNEGDLAGIRIVAAYPGGSQDLPSSWNRVAGYTSQLRDKFGVEIVDSIDALLEKVDVVFLMSVDGRPHWQQAQPVLKAGKPVFIDKPIAGSLADAMRIFKLAEETGTPCFSSSSLRFSPNIQALRNNPNVGDVVGCTTHSPCELEEHHPDLFWYGIHGVEELYTIMGTGCASVARVHTDGVDFVVGTWDGGRVGTFRGLRDGKRDYGVLVYGTKGIEYTSGYGGYAPLVEEICKFFRTHKPPVSAAETIELAAFMEAADQSKKQGGCPVTIESVMARAREEIAHDSATPGH